MADYTFSYSELNDLRQCPLKWQITWWERWNYTGVGSGARERGRNWHRVMEAYHGHQLTSGLRRPRNRMKQAMQHVLFRVIPRLGIDSEETELMRWMFTGYYEYYLDADEEWETLAVEFRHELPIGPGLRVKIRADQIVRQRGSKRIWLVDSKTSRNKLKEEELQLHPEMGLYTWALRRAGLAIWGTIYDWARTYKFVNEAKQELPDRFARPLLHHSDRFLETIRQDAVRDMSRALIDVPRTLPGKPAKADMPRHYDSERCRWRCDYLDPCIAGARKNAQRMRDFLEDTGYEQNYERH